MSVFSTAIKPESTGLTSKFPSISSLIVSGLGSFSLVGAIFCFYKAHIQGLPQVYLPLDTEWQKAWQAGVLPQEKVTDVTVEVVGAVEKPGVFTLSSGSRVQDAILQAGGFATDAHIAYIHRDLSLAASLVDQQKIYIPFSSEEPAKHSQSPGATTVTGGSNALNSVTAAQLQDIAGIGEVRSQHVLDGIPYSSQEDFLERSQLPEAIARDVLDKYSL